MGLPWLLGLVSSGEGGLFDFEWEEAWETIAPRFGWIPELCRSPLAPNRSATAACGGLSLPETALPPNPGESESLELCAGGQDGGSGSTSAIVLPALATVAEEAGAGTEGGATGGLAPRMAPGATGSALEASPSALLGISDEPPSALGTNQGVWDAFGGGVPPATTTGGRLPRKAGVGKAEPVTGGLSVTAPTALNGLGALGRAAGGRSTGTERGTGGTTGAAAAAAGGATGNAATGGSSPLGNAGAHASMIARWFSAICVSKNCLLPEIDKSIHCPHFQE